MASHIVGYPRMGPNRELKFALESFWDGKSSAADLEKVAKDLRASMWKQMADAGLKYIPSNTFAYYDQVLDTTAMVGAVPPRYGWMGGEIGLDIYFSMARGNAKLPAMEMTKWFDTNYHYIVPELGPDVMLGAVPARYGWTDGEIGFDIYFSMARGNAKLPAMEMTKWFDTNYHYIVPELSPDNHFSYASHKAVNEYKEAKELGIETVPVILGPVSYLLLSKPAKGVGKTYDLLSLLDGILPVYKEVVAELKAAGTTWVQFDEPYLVMDLETHQLEAFAKAYSYLEGATSGVKLLVETYFADLPVETYKTITALKGISAIGFDLIRGTKTLSLIKEVGFPADKLLFAGVVDGRNIWANDLAASLSVLEGLENIVGKDKLVVSTSCSLMHSAVDLVNETKLDSELKSWLAFAAQKIVEVDALAKAMVGQKDEAFFAANAAAQASRRSSPRVNNEAVQKAEKFYNKATLHSTPASVIKKIVHLVSTKLGNSSLNALELGFQDPSTDMATRISFKQPQIILLKEGTDTSQGKPQLISNINACTAIVDTVRTTLGPRGMDKLIHDDKGATTISNDGATIMKLLDIVHPAAKILVDIAKSQDSEVQGGNMRDSFLVKGVAFKKTFSYGFEQQPKKFVNPKLLLLNVELELKSEKENAEAKLDKCVQSGAKIVLSRLAIGDLATQYFADRDVFCAGRVTEEDLQRVAAATGGSVQTSVNNIVPEVLGTCELFEEKQVGNERFNIFSGCPSGQTATIVLRGGADQFIDEAERSLHDAIMIVRRALKNSTVVAGGGAIDMEISRYLRQHARTIAGKSQLFINSYAKALEVIPRQLCDNAGFDATDVLNKLRQKHALPSGEGALYGVDINTGGITDSFANFVWEPAVVKINAINAATEAACLILSVDETVKNPKSESAQGEGVANAMAGRGRGGGFRGRGRGMRRR